MCQLAIVDVDGANVQAHGLRIADRQMPQTADAGDDHPLARSCLRLLQPLVGGDTGTNDRRRIHRSQTGRDVGDVVRVGNDVLGEATVLRVTAVFRLAADGFPGCQTVFAVATSRVKPRHADPVTFLHHRHAGPDRDHPPDALVARNERQRCLDGKIATHRVQVGVTHAAGFGLDQNLAHARCWHHPFAQRQRLAKLFDSSDLHSAGHVGAFEKVMEAPANCQHDGARCAAMWEASVR